MPTGTSCTTDLSGKLPAATNRSIIEVDRTMARVPWEMIAEGPGIDPLGTQAAGRETTQDDV